MEDDKRLIPILREGVDVVKMVFFRKLKTYLSARYRDHDASYINMLAGAIINDLFGTPNQGEPFVTFVEENAFRISEEKNLIATAFKEMRIPLTDALRIQFLCDHQDGIDSSSVLSQAKDLGVLIVERDVPLPAQFISLVRRLGTAYDILAGG